MGPDSPTMGIGCGCLTLSGPKIELRFRRDFVAGSPRRFYMMGALAGLLCKHGGPGTPRWMGDDRA